MEKRWEGKRAGGGPRAPERILEPPGAGAGLAVPALALDRGPAPSAPCPAGGCRSSQEALPRCRFFERSLGPGSPHTVEFRLHLTSPRSCQVGNH